jgi:4-hydroxybenzoate polyprenyltransferase
MLAAVSGERQATRAGRPAGPSGRLRRLLAGLRLVHPFPSLANVAATTAFGVIALHGFRRPAELARLALTMLLIQCAIGATNDTVDAPLDALSKPYKPIVAGVVSRRTAGLIALALALGATVLAKTLGGWGWLLAMAGLACGLSYDLWLKRSAYSPLPYLLAFSIYPLWVWAALHRFSAALLWEVPLALLLGASLYLGNTAPDVERDRAAGVQGFAHHLGVRRAVWLSWGALALALAAGLLIALPAGLDRVRVALGVCVALVPAATGAWLSVRDGSPRSLERAWGLQVAAVVAFSAGFLSALP